jgi:sorting nexin-1/2
MPETPTKSPSSRQKGTPRTLPRSQPRRAGRLSVGQSHFEDLDLDAGPLGPLGEALLAQPDTPPIPPAKESGQRSRSASNDLKPLPETPQFSIKPSAESLNVEEQGSSEEPQIRESPSILVEQVAKPSFDIFVGDPHKIGDLTSSHTVYKVRTKVIRIYISCLY